MNLFSLCGFGVSYRDPGGQRVIAVMQKNLTARRVSEQPMHSHGLEMCGAEFQILGGWVTHPGQPVADTLAHAMSGLASGSGQSDFVGLDPKAH